MKKHLCFWLCIAAYPLLFLSCAGLKKESGLDPVSEDFLSRVRYIITKEESKIFRELPPSARPRFIEEFWERRDPTPETETNEYREAYFERIEEANRLFRGAQPGWLQDRGRIYILFGPPNERQTNPMGGRPIDPYEDPKQSLEGTRVATGEKPTEVWVYYNLFSSFQQPHAVKLVFVDSQGTGNYTLTTDLDEISPSGLHTSFEPDLVFTHELYKEEAKKAALRSKRALFDFSWELLKVKNKEAGSNLSVLISLPYRKIIFGNDQGTLRAGLAFHLEIRDVSGTMVWQQDKDSQLEFKQAQLEQNKEDSWEMTVPVLRWLEKGRYSLYIRLENRTAGQLIEKLLKLKM
ncbi:MAG: GWxTD domain-containing protein [Clostridiales bacterium]|nr:GWxTD domain-containing protein [Clostridiales bacterium]